MGKRFTLILGGARSGKSAFAQQLAMARGEKVLFVATATAGDEEMAARITAHKNSRPAHWKTLEASSGVGAAIQQEVGESDVVLLDCLTLLAANVLAAQGDSVSEDQADAGMRAETDGLLAAYDDSDAEWIVISNEVGLGLVPPYPLGRVYRDALGRANQFLARHADEVIFMVAGLPLNLKPSPTFPI
jgi:adenosylcobinamide kinase / adenosylcobinamide-phosphate guanylyltransferase